MKCKLRANCRKGVSVAISIILVRKILLSLFIISLFFFLINLPSTYSYFTSKAETGELVLETGEWVIEADMTFELDEKEPSDQLGTMSDNNGETLTAKIYFPDKVDVKGIDLKTLELDYLGDLIMPVIGSEKYEKSTLILQFDLKELAKLLEGTEEDDVLLTLRGSGNSFSFTAVGKLPFSMGKFPLRWADSEEEKDKAESAKSVAITINGPREIIIPAEGDVEAVYSLEITDEGNMLSDQDVRWKLAEEVEGVSLDRENTTIIVSTEAMPGTIKLAASVGVGSDYSSEIVIALIENEAEREGSGLKEEEPEAAGVEEVSGKKEKEPVDEEKPAEEGEEPEERSTEDDSSEGSLKEREDEDQLKE